MLRLGLAKTTRLTDPLPMTLSPRDGQRSPFGESLHPAVPEDFLLSVHEERHVTTDRAPTLPLCSQERISAALSTAKRAKSDIYHGAPHVMVEFLHFPI